MSGFLVTNRMAAPEPRRVLLAEPAQTKEHAGGVHEVGRRPRTKQVVLTRKKRQEPLDRRWGRRPVEFEEHSKLPLGHDGSHEPLSGRETVRLERFAGLENEFLFSLKELFSPKRRVAGLSKESCKPFVRPIVTAVVWFWHLPPH